MRSLSKILLALLFVTSVSFAGYRDKVIWHRSYFVSLGLDVLFSVGGDLDGKGFLEADGDDADETVYIPYI